jgi:non-canonical purine NTP pyrophosphatase (RdgB/HAM1 family)
MPLPNLVFVTSSADKHREAEGVLGYALTRAALDLEEPQGLDVRAIARHKARAAFTALAQPVLVEDTALELDALGGFPGPLVRWLLTAAGPAAIPRLLDGFADRGATARCVAVVWDGVREWSGEGAVHGVITAQPSGSAGFGWDVVFAPNWGGGRTYAELTSEEKNARSHRALALRALREELSARPG